MTKSGLIALFTVIFIGSGIGYHQYQGNQEQVLHKAHNQNEAVEALTQRMESQVCAVYEDGSVTMISSHDNQAYVVRPDQTLGEAVAQGALAVQERGNCVRQDPDNPPR